MIQVKDRQEKPTLMMSSSSKLRLPRVMKPKPLQQKAEDNDECDHTHTTGTNSSAFSFINEAPHMSCMKQTMITAVAPNTKKVAFDSLDVHEHAIILGDNPSVSSGPPLTISWEAQSSIHLSLVTYEAARPPRRDKGEMPVPLELRENWLRHAGYARYHFIEVDKMIQKTKQERAASAKSTLMDLIVYKLTKDQRVKALSLPRKPSA